MSLEQQPSQATVTSRTPATSKSNSTHITGSKSPEEVTDSSIDTDFGPTPSDCQLGQQFFNQTQCEHFCSPGSCEMKLVDQIWWECSFCSSPGSCVNGDYPSTYSCSKNCEGGHCEVTAGIRNVTCSKCPDANGCKAGAYDSFSDCWQDCGPGLCSENAGQRGILCTC